MIPLPAPNVSSEMVLASAKAITRSILSLAVKHVLEQTSVRGWTIAEPTDTQLSEIRKILIATTQPDFADGQRDVYPFPDDYDTNLLVTKGEVDVLNSSGEIISSIGAEGQTFHFAPRGSGQSMRAKIHPSQVVCVLWKEVETSGTEAGVV